MLGRRCGLAGLLNKHFPEQQGQIVRRSTSQGKLCHRFSIFTLVLISTQTYDSDTGYMTTSGPCPIFEGLVPVFFNCLFVVLMPCHFFSRITEIGSKYGPFDIAMLPIWRGGTLSFIARLGFRVSISSFYILSRKNSQMS
jgi:hypothetical protein